ncbi:DUF1040 family protein [Salinibius halmophilus]|uniref:DUF1040 family protein n=1 Tax=Salinibius halmophilus TaxID=1853216 RepID=UPI000E672645|nr:DUF1040 family protein [Salinibius halmophilus]
MQTHKIEEVCQLLQEAWLESPNDSLLSLIAGFAKSAKHEGALDQLSDDVLFYQLKMRHHATNDMIPGIAKDCEDDFKAAILRARGIEKDA